MISSKTNAELNLSSLIESLELYSKPYVLLLICTNVCFTEFIHLHVNTYTVDKADQDL